MSESSTKLSDRIDQYMLGKLTEDELAEFEIQMLEDEQLLEEVQRQEGLISALRDSKTVLSESKAGSDRSPGPSSKSETNVVNFAQWIRQPLSIAASVLLLLGSVLIIPEQLNNTPYDSTFSDLSAVRSDVVLETLRGDERSVPISGTPPILISIDVGPAPSGLFNVSLVEPQSNEVIARLENIELAETGLVRVLLNRGLVGEYVVVASSADQGYTQSFPVRFTE